MVEPIAGRSKPFHSIKKEQAATGEREIQVRSTEPLVPLQYSDGVMHGG